MKKITESTKVTLTLKQLKRLVKEAATTASPSEPNYDGVMEFINYRILRRLNKVPSCPEFAPDYNDGWGGHDESGNPSGKFETYLNPSIGDDAEKVVDPEEDVDGWREEMERIAENCWKKIAKALEDESRTSDFHGIRVWFAVQYDGATSINLDPTSKAWDPDEIMDGYEAIFVDHIDL